jgi:hypothetical protein
MSARGVCSQTVIAHGRRTHHAREDLGAGGQCTLAYRLVCHHSPSRLLKVSRHAG